MAVELYFAPNINQYIRFFSNLASVLNVVLKVTSTSNAFSKPKMLAKFTVFETGTCKGISFRVRIFYSYYVQFTSQETVTSVTICLRLSGVVLH